MIYPNPQIYHHLRTIFVHVPKTGGTSIERTLRQSENDVVGGHTTALGFKKAYADLFEPYYKFAIVRDPVDRFMSAWSYLAQEPVHAALNNQRIHECGSVNAFIRLLTEDPSIIRGIVHLLPQHEFICDQNGKVLVDSVHRFESLADAWLDICRKTGLGQVTLPKLNASRREPRTAVCRETEAAIHRLYAKDFEIFGYP